jgi:hypothetical protein
MNKVKREAVKLIWDYCTQIQRSRAKKDINKYATMIKFLCDDMLTIYNVADNEYDLLLKIKDMPRKEQIKLWVEFTGKSEATLRNRLKNIYLPKSD